MDVFLLILRLVLSGVFGVSGLAKLFDRQGSEQAAAAFGVPKTLTRPVAVILPVAEIILSISLLLVASSWFAAVAAAVFLGVFIGGMAYQLARGNAPDCHCFGQLSREPISISSILRNAALLIFAGILISQGRGRQGVSFIASDQDIMMFVFGIAVLGVLGAIAFLLRGISEEQKEIARQIELLDVIGREGGAVERETASHPQEGLPIGAYFPAFELANIEGKAVSLARVRSTGRPVLFFFVGPNCAPCKALIPEFLAWQNELADRLEVVYISSGTSAENVTRFGPEIAQYMLLQESRELADAAKAKWTPTAVLMDRHGRVASHAAAGDAAIKALIEQIRAEDLDSPFVHFTNGAGHSNTKNRIGSTIPKFEARDIHGRPIDSGFFKGKRTLVTFWSLNCGFCEQMLEDLRSWDKVKGEDEPDLLLFSDGDPEKNKELGFTSPLIIDENYKTAEHFGMVGTPSAVLVDEEGRIISETAVGADDIWALITNKK